MLFFHANESTNPIRTFFFHLQVPSGKQASVFVDASKFNVHTRSAKGRCPFDFMRIKGIDESLAPAAFNATTNSV